MKYKIVKVLTAVTAEVTAKSVPAATIHNYFLRSEYGNMAYNKVSPITNVW
jgi:hypothetical protein